MRKLLFIFVAIAFLCSIAFADTTDNPRFWTDDPATGHTLSWSTVYDAWVNSIDLAVGGKLSAVTYGSDGSITDAEFLYINTLGSNAQTQITARMPLAGGTFTGDISYAISIITAGGDAISVANINVLVCNPSGASADIVIGGLRNGIEGNIIDIVIISVHAEHDVTIEYKEGGGQQDIYLTSGIDEEYTDYGGWRLYCDGTNWYQIGAAK